MKLTATDKRGVYHTDDPGALVDALVALNKVDENEAARYRPAYGNVGKTMLTKLRRGTYAKFQHHINDETAYIAIYYNGRVVCSGYMSGGCERDIDKLITKDGV